MTSSDLNAKLEQAIAERNDERGKGGAAKVARLLGIHDSALSQYRKGDYTSPHTIEARIREVFGNESVDCPELGELTLAECSAYRRLQPTTDSFYARMFRACKSCERRN